MNTPTRSDEELIQSYAEDLGRRGASAEMTGRFLDALGRLYPTRPTDFPERSLVPRRAAVAAAGPGDRLWTVLLVAAIVLTYGFHAG